MEALCVRFRGQKEPLEKLIDMRQVGSLKSYIQDSDILWIRVEIYEKEALVLFIRGLKVEIKNLVNI